MSIGMVRHLSGAGIVFGALMAVAAPAPAETPKGTLRVATQSFKAASPSPFQTGSYTDLSVTILMYEGLVYLDQDGQPRPRLATSWEILDEGREIVFKLREGVRFADGTPFDAAAVKANFDYVKTAPADKVLPSISGQIKTIKTVEVADPMTLRITLTGQNALETMVWLGMQAGLLASPADFDKPVGTGPFVLNREKTAIDFTVLVLDANPNYWNPDDVGVAQIEVHRMPDPNSRLVAFNAGQFDAVLAFGSGGEPQHGRADFNGRSLQMLTIADWQGKIVPALAQKEVRCALVQAFNKRGVTALFKQPPETARDQWAAAPGDYAWIDDLDVPQFDIDKAQEVLNAAGAGTFKLSSGYTANLPSSSNLLTAWKGGLQRLGIDLELETFQDSAELAVATAEGRYPILYTPPADPNLLIPLLQRAHPDGPLNPAKAAPPGVAELIETARTKDSASAEADIAGAWKIMLEECIWVPALHLTSGFWVSDRVEGFRVLPIFGQWEPRGIRVKD